MSASLRTASLTAIAIAALALTACAPAAPPGGGATDKAIDKTDDASGGGSGAGGASTDDALRACLAAHDPWSLDLERLLDEHVAWAAGLVPGEAQPSEWSVEGTATMGVHDGSSSWVFNAEGVAFNVTVPSREGPYVARSYQEESQTAEFDVAMGYLMLSKPTNDVHVDETTTRLPDGNIAEAFFPLGSAPVFPWSRDIATGASEGAYAMTCSESELVITTSAPYGYHFTPGA